jgi:hypothetical protein
MRLGCGGGEDGAGSVETHDRMCARIFDNRQEVDEGEVWLRSIYSV